MNALYISYDGVFDPLGQSQVLPYIKGLSKKNINFILITFEKQYYADKNQIQEFRKELRKNKIRWIKLNYHKNPPLLSTIFDIAYSLVIAAIIIKKEKITIVHARSYISALIALILKKTFKTKFIFDMRGFWADEKVDVGTWKKSGILYRLFRILEKHFIIQSDKIVVLTEKANETIINFGYLKNIKKDIFVIPTCVDLELFKIERNHLFGKDKDKSNQFTIVYSGSIGTWYMIEEMIDFFYEMKKQITNAEFLFLSTSGQKQIKEIMKKRGFNSAEYMMVGASYAQVPYWLNYADASIFFIKPLFSKIASCPTKLAESLACGLPVITNIGIGDSEDIITREKVGVVVKQFDIECYHKAIQEIKKFFSEPEPLRFRCRNVAEKYFSLEKGIEEYLNIYSALNDKL